MLVRYLTNFVKKYYFIIWVLNNLLNKETHFLENDASALQGGNVITRVDARTHAAKTSGNKARKKCTITTK